MKRTKDIERFSGYNRTLAECHLHNWGVIILDDEYEQPLEVEEALHVIESLREDDNNGRK